MCCQRVGVASPTSSSAAGGGDILWQRLILVCELTAHAYHACTQGGAAEAVVADAVEAAATFGSRVRSLLDWRCCLRCLPLSACSTPAMACVACQQQVCC